MGWGLSPPLLLYIEKTGDVLSLDPRDLILAPPSFLPNEEVK